MTSIPLVTPDSHAAIDHTGIPGVGGGSGSGAVGYLPYLYPTGLTELTSFGSNDDLAANGGSYLIPFFLPAPMKLHGASFRNEDGGSARSWEFRLYLDTNAGVTLSEVANANGTDSFTGAGNQIRTAACGTPPTLDPGVYWMVFRNTHGSNTLRVSFATAGTNMDLVTIKLKTLGSSLGSSLDLDSGWSTSENLPGIVLRGRVMGQSVAWV